MMTDDDVTRGTSLHRSMTHALRHAKNGKAAIPPAAASCTLARAHHFSLNFSQLETSILVSNGSILSFTVKYIKITPLFTQMNVALPIPIYKVMPRALPALISCDLAKCHSLLKLVFIL
jgi:hypothetical protein